MECLCRRFTEVALPDPKWPQPCEADEDPDPLYNSRRSYLEQIDRYKRHLGKPIQLYRRKKFFVPAEIAEMRELRDAGMSLEAMAKHFGVTKSAVSYHVKNRGWQRPPANHRQ